LVSTYPDPRNDIQNPAEIHAPPPTLGQHNEEVLTMLLGYSPEDVASLKNKKSI